MPDASEPDRLVCLLTDHYGDVLFFGNSSQEYDACVPAAGIPLLNNRDTAVMVWVVERLLLCRTDLAPLQPRWPTDGSRVGIFRRCTGRSARVILPETLEAQVVYRAREIFRTLYSMARTRQ